MGSWVNDYRDLITNHLELWSRLPDGKFQSGVSNWWRWGRPQLHHTEISSPHSTSKKGPRGGMEVLLLVDLDAGEVVEAFPKPLKPLPSRP